MRLMGLVDPNEPDAKVKFLAAETPRGVGGLLPNNTGARFVDELEKRDRITGQMRENGKVRSTCCLMYKHGLTNVRSTRSASS